MRQTTLLGSLKAPWPRISSSHTCCSAVSANLTAFSPLPASMWGRYTFGAEHYLPLSTSTTTQPSASPEFSWPSQCNTFLNFTSLLFLSFSKSFEFEYQWLIICRIIESFELEDTHLVQLPCKEQGYIQLDQIAQSSAQPDLECLQGCGIHHLSGQPAQSPHYSYHKEVFHYIWCKPPLF